MASRVARHVYPIRRLPWAAWLVAGAALGGCGGSTFNPSDQGVPGDDASLGPLTCTPCVTSDDCAPAGQCVQYGGDNYCAAGCTTDAECAPGETCIPLAGIDGTQVQGCVPRGGACGGGGCGACDPGEECDVTTGTCLAATPDAGPGPAPTTCGTLVSPATSACCASCQAGVGRCQPNGCYSGWWCDTAACRCHSPPTTCGGADGGVGGGGDGGTIAGTIGPGGGKVDHLYFAVVGDTRPGTINDTAGYPTAIITRIYADIEKMSPRPQFVVTTGDYIFASASGNQGLAQMTLYAGAARQFTGPIFAALGNHECTGGTSSNCAIQPNNNYEAYMDALVRPLGKTLPYYTVPITALDGKAWTAKIIVTACNAWSTTQRSWFAAELARPTTYTFVVRHEPRGITNAPCVTDEDALLQTAAYNLLIVGHSHTLAKAPREIVVGNGGAPLAGGGDYGFATVEQRGGLLLVTGWDYLTVMPVASYTFQ